MSDDIDWKTKYEHLMVKYLQDAFDLGKEIAQLKTRLEIQPGTPYDGIATRDATIKALEVDARRYRWLKENAKDAGMWDDASIDAAMEE